MSDVTHTTNDDVRYDPSFGGASQIRNEVTTRSDAHVETVTRVKRNRDSIGQVSEYA